jgi:hypothetical protein
MDNYLMINKNDKARTTISFPMKTVQTLLICKFK